jgi:hypothetical protein
MRDRLAIGLANWILRHLATKRTATFISGAIEYGMSAALRDERSGASAPTPWRVTFGTSTLTMGSDSKVTFRTVP